MGDCGPGCGCKGETSRRDLLRLGMSVAGVMAGGRSARAAEGDIPASCRIPPPQAWFDELLRPGEPIVYRGEQLRNLLFPVGGIGTGTIWINGAGRLVNWQIFNNIQKSSQVDDSFLAVRVEQEGRPPIVRALQTVPVGPFVGVQEIEVLGRYPVATIRYRDRDLPVDIELEAWNPLIPLNAQDSAIPCAIFSLRAINKSADPVKVAFLASFQNAVGHADGGGSSGVSHGTYGGNSNRAVQGIRFSAVSMGAEPGKPAEIRPPIELMIDHEALPMIAELPVEGLTLTGIGSPPSKANIPSIYWIGRGDVKRLGGSALLEIVQAVRDRGAVLLLTGVANPLLGQVSANAPAGALRSEVVYENFDSPDFGKWTTTGQAFRRPRSGTMGGQNAVSGFLGSGLVNSYDPDDASAGTLTSPRFPIDHKYLSFLIGGGESAACAVQLKVEGKVVLSATGKNNETLSRVEWEVSKWRGQEAVIEIVDKSSSGWGHILVDDIRFSSLAIDAITPEEAEAWNAMVADARKAPAMSETGFGRGKIVIVPLELGTLQPGVDRLLQQDRALQLVASLAGATYRPAAGRPADAPSFGTMCVATSEASATWRTAWTDRRELFEAWSRTGRLESGPDSAMSARPPTEAGETVNSAICAGGEAAPGQTMPATFVLAWHFSNQYYPQNAWKPSGNTAVKVGNMYANWFPDATAVARYVLANRDRLYAATSDFVRAMFDTTLPQYLVDTAAANISILRGPTCFWIKDGTFYGFEGSNFEGGGCCPMNCNHVWNYEQTLAKLWPELERDMRVTELDYHMQPDGGIHHRVEVPRTKPDKRQIMVADGQCGAILKAYREHLQSPDHRFLDDHWPKIRKAMDYAITTWDSDNDGIMEKPQFNTYDRVIYGHNTFISSLYLAALRAAEEMAKLTKDADAAKKYRDLFDRGSRKIAETLYDGEYYIQKADDINLGYGKGCFSDQVVGQWWARVLGLGDLLPSEQMQSALRAVFKHNWLWSQEGFEGTQRFLQFADGKDKGLLIGSWPKGGRPKDPILYRDEIWTGVEYQVAGHKIYDGQLLEGLTIVRGARERYHGVKKSPWNEIECGDYYARAMSSWSLLLAAQGYHYDGPARLLQFAPRVGVAEHRSFYSTADGWGQYSQQREKTKQTSVLSLASGRCDLRTIRLGVPEDARQLKGLGRLNETELSAEVKTSNGFAVLELLAPVTLEAGGKLTVELEWN